METHRADTTVTLQPGANPNLAMRLEPLQTKVGITVTFGGVRFSLDDTTTRVLRTGDLIRIVASATRADGSEVPPDSLLWATSNPAVVRVDGGIVTAVSPGSAVVSAGYGGASARVSIEVLTVPPAPVQYTNANFGLVAGEPDSIRLASGASVVIEEFDFDIRVEFDYVSRPLTAGRAYRLRISGKGRVGPGNDASMSDVAFSPCFSNLDFCQVRLNTANWAAGWDDIAGRRPFPDVYVSSHVYDYYVLGRGAALTWRFRDSPYSDNVGGFRISISLMGTPLP